MSFGGNSVSISGGKVFINGKDVTPDSKEINISVEGNCEKISADSCNQITITGDAGSIETMSGRVEISGSVKGSVQTMSGRVECGEVHGSVSSMSGRIETKKT